MSARTLAVSLIWLVLATVTISHAEVRTWSDRTGKFKVEAELVSENATRVRLKLETGKIIEVPLEKLSDADKRFLKERRSNPSEPAANTELQKLYATALAVYTFDEESSAGNNRQTPDASSNGAHGTILGPTSVPGVVGKALKYDGRDDHVRIPKLIELLRQDLTAFSASLWLRSAQAKGSFAFDAGFYGESVAFQLDAKGARFLIPTKAGGRPLSFGIPKDDQWHHFVLNWDGASQRVYVDGKDVANLKTKARGKLNASTLGGPSELRFGSQTKTDRQAQRYLAGEIDEVAFFDRALTSTEVAMLHRQGKSESSLAKSAPANPASARSGAAAVGTLKPVKLKIGEVTKIQAHATGQHVTGASFSGDGAFLATGCWDKAVKVWSVADGKLQAEAKNLDDKVRAVAFVGDAVAFSTAAGDSLQMWNWRSNKVIQLEALGDCKWLDYCATTDNLFAPNKKLLSRWDKTGKALPRFVLPDTAQGCDITADGKLIAMMFGGTLGGENSRVGILDSGSGKLQLEVHTSTEIFYDVAISDDGQFAAAAHAEDHISVIDVTRKRKTKVLAGHPDSGAWNVEFIPNSHVLVSAGWLDSHVRFWNISTGKQIASVEIADVFAVRSLAVSPDGRMIAVGDDEGSLRWWTIQ
jgi:WD40 repeat protein